MTVGPMAQNFRAASGLGSEDKTTSTLHGDGVRYTTILSLVEELRERDKSIDELKAKSARVDQFEG